ncbi:MAG: methyltransferase domain-containing protein [Tannerellaceae bacterium]|jgi:SAM-dependent methyltransferase|nr:methyltransferase domain-containing protein [Tannerellaceae bacterium]
MNLGVRRILGKCLLQWLLRGNNVLQGNNVYCPCCEKHFAVFWFFGKPIRFNAMCPSCRSLERHRLLWMFLFRENRLITNGTKLLHIAPENALFKKFKQEKKIYYFPGDKFMPGNYYPQGTKEIDILNITYPDNFFDAILCCHVLEHVDNDLQAMKEFYRVLKPSGWAILQVPIDYNRADTFEDNSITTPEEREKYFGQHDHLRLYGRDYPQRLMQAGFKVECIDFCNTFSEEEQKLMGFDKNDGIIYLCKKG